jgi:hypothetical protein
MVISLVEVVGYNGNLAVRRLSQRWNQQGNAATS